ncbi:MAG: hypothetical protein LBS79_05775 [Tannerella sp.]|jgi:hypothetical protein|nr:hypothetical protein [Tannerella sp.]
MPFVIIYTLICFIVARIFVRDSLSEVLCATLCCFICTPFLGIWVYRKL